MVAENHAAESVLDYVHQLVEHTRASEDTILGVSTRGAIAMVRAARVWAAAQGRNYILADDIKGLAAPVWTHRLVMSPTRSLPGPPDARSSHGRCSSRCTHGGGDGLSTDVSPGSRTDTRPRASAVHHATASSPPGRD